MLQKMLEEAWERFQSHCKITLVKIRLDPAFFFMKIF